MKTGNFNINDYLERLYEEAENTDKQHTTDAVAGLVIPEENKKHFDWLSKEYQKSKTEVKVEIKGEGSSFKPGYELQTDLKSVKDFKPGMYGDIKTSDTEGKSKTEKPKSPKNNKGDNPAEDKEPKGDNEAKNDTKEKSDKSPKAQSMKIDVTSKKKEND